jgi:hypothetical protein
MAEVTVQGLKTAFMKAHQAGDKKNARAFALRLQSMQQQPQAQPQPVDPTMPQPSAILDRPDSPEAMAERQEAMASQQRRPERGGVMQEIEQLPIVGGAVAGVEDVRRGLGQTAANIMSATGAEPYEQQAQDINREMREREQRIPAENAPSRFIGRIAGSAPMAAGNILTASLLGSASSPYITKEGKEGDLGDFLTEKAIETTAGIVTGGLIHGGQRLFQKSPKTMTSDEIRKAAGRLYKQADEKGGILTSDVTDSFVDEIQKLKPQTDIGQIVGGESQFSKLVNKVSEIRGRNMSLAEAQELDELLGEAMDSFVDSGRLTKQGKKILDIQTILRDKIENTSADLIVGGKEGFEALKEGRKLWAQSRKLADVERIIERASRMEQPATGIKSGFRALLANPKRLRGFTPAERKAMKKASESGFLQDITRTFGSRLVPIVTGASGGGLGGTAAATLGSTASRGVGARIQADKAREVAEIIARGGGAAPARQALSAGQQAIGRGAATGSAALTGEAVAPDLTETAPTAPQAPRPDPRIERQERLRRALQGMRQNAPQPQAMRQSAPQPAGQGDGLLDRIAIAESGGDPNAKARTSSASGLFQFTDPTWRAMVRKYGKDTGITTGDKSNPQAQRVMADKLVQENKRILSKKLGRRPTDGELYIAHFAGPNVANKIIKRKDKNITAKNVVPRSYYEANKSIFKDNRTGRMRTTAEVYELLANKVD